jgi:hypothetical protein
MEEQVRSTGNMTAHRITVKEKKVVKERRAR